MRQDKPIVQFDTVPQKIFFSVVIPVYNRVIPLRKTLYSVKSQTMTGFEVWIVDDGSTPENTIKIKELVASLQDSRFSVISYPNNKNGAYARNKGIEHSRGKFIAFLDSDDEWDSNKLSIMKQRIDEIKGEFYYHQYANVENGKHSSPLPKQGISPVQSVADYSFCTNQGGGIQSSCIVVSTKLAKDIRFNESLKGHQDWDFALRAAESSGPIIFVPGAYTKRHVAIGHIGMVSGSLDYLYSLSFLRSYERYFSWRAKAAYATYVLENKRWETTPKPLPSIYQLLGYCYFPLTNFRIFLQHIRIERRCEALYRHCRSYNIKKIALLGYNRYTLLFLNRFGSHFSQISLIDRHRRNTTEYGKVKGLDDISSMEFDNVQLFVAMTDKHFQSMQNDLSKHIGTALKLRQF